MFPFLSDTFRAPGATTTASDFSGTWENRNGAEINLKQAGESIRGSYRTAVGLIGESAEFDLVGFACGDRIVFSVCFSVHSSLTAWTGQHTEGADGSERIHALWHMARNIPDDDQPSNVWAGVIAGADTFFRVAAGEEEETDSGQ